MLETTINLIIASSTALILLVYFRGLPLIDKIFGNVTKLRQMMEQNKFEVQKQQPLFQPIYKCKDQFYIPSPHPIPGFDHIDTTRGREQYVLPNARNLIHTIKPIKKKQYNYIRVVIPSDTSGSNSVGSITVQMTPSSSSKKEDDNSSIQSDQSPLKVQPPQNIQPTIIANNTQTPILIPIRLTESQQYNSRAAKYFVDERDVFSKQREDFKTKFARMKEDYAFYEEDEFKKDHNGSHFKRISMIFIELWNRNWELERMGQILSEHKSLLKRGACKDRTFESEEDQKIYVFCHLTKFIIGKVQTDCEELSKKAIIKDSLYSEKIAICAILVHLFSTHCNGNTGQQNNNNNTNQFMSYFISELQNTLRALSATTASLPQTVAQMSHFYGISKEEQMGTDIALKKYISKAQLLAFLFFYLISYDFVGYPSIVRILEQHTAFLRTGDQNANEVEMQIFKNDQAIKACKLTKGCPQFLVVFLSSFFKLPFNFLSVFLMRPLLECLIYYTNGCYIKQGRLFKGVLQKAFTLYNNHYEAYLRSQPFREEMKSLFNLKFSSCGADKTKWPSEYYYFQFELKQIQVWEKFYKAINDRNVGNREYYLQHALNEREYYCKRMRVIEFVKYLIKQKEKKGFNPQEKKCYTLYQIDCLKPDYLGAIIKKLQVGIQNPDSQLKFVIHQIKAQQFIKEPIEQFRTPGDHVLIYIQKLLQIYYSSAILHDQDLKK